MQNDELRNSDSQSATHSPDEIADSPAGEDVINEIDYDAPNPDETRMIELVGYLVQGLVAHPEEVEVEEFFDDMGTVYGVRVHPEDIGRIIGKEGRVANALRQVVKAAATKANAHVMVEILTDDENLPLVDSGDAEPSPV
jgi:predicted RNA-binding protein YlqC (UPF0109 family)